jgi:hypothetical protein
LAVTVFLEIWFPEGGCLAQAQSPVCLSFVLQMSRYSCQSAHIDTLKL